MFISQKCQYGLRAMFELSLRYGEGPVKIADIAENQAIPPRFLEVILSQLKQGGFVESRRGSEGGYFLSVAPADLTVGDIIRFIEGPVEPAGCDRGRGDKCPLLGDCVFQSMWESLGDAISEVYDSTNFLSLIEEYRHKKSEYVPQYSI